MRLTLAHLYPDLMNLYGENGNVEVIKYILENNGYNVTVEDVTLEDHLQFKDYDIVYIGSGTENNQKLVLKHLLKYRHDIEKYINADKLFIATGNAIELFGKTIEANQTTYAALNLFNFTTQYEGKRLVSETVLRYADNDIIIGFQNQGGSIRDNPTAWLKVLKGIGSYPGSIYEGVQEHRFYGTYLLGPVLARNPHLTKYILDKGLKTNLKGFFKLDKLAYDQYVKDHYQKYVDTEE